MRTSNTANRPDYVNAFTKEAGTTIKHINGSWYLYRKDDVYNPITKRSKTVTKEYLGKITEHGLIPRGQREKKEKPIEPVEDASLGAVLFFHNRSLSIREKLAKYFPDSWEKIYAAALMRTVFTNRFKNCSLNYEESVISYMYPGLALSRSSMTEFLNKLGKKRDCIRAYMNEDMGRSSMLIVDGHRLITASKSMKYAEKGYDSRHRYKNQINLVYVFAEDKDGTGFPAYYKQFPGGFVDLYALNDMLNEMNVPSDNCVFVADKGFAWVDNLSIIDESDSKYIMALDRGNKHVKDRMPEKRADYSDVFVYEQRQIFHICYAEEGINVHLYLDPSLETEENRDLANRVNNSNAEKTVRKDKELDRREKGKGKLSDDELKKLESQDLLKALTADTDAGTLTLITNNLDLSGQETYEIYKQREHIEQFFDTYDHVMEYDSSYMHSTESEEGWLFLNHLSMIMTVDAMNYIASIDKSDEISVRDLIDNLNHISIQKIDGRYTVYPGKKKLQDFCAKLQFNPTDISSLGLK